MIVNNPSKNIPRALEIKILARTISKTYLFRLAGLADVINRFIDIQLKDKVNWLKTFALIILTIDNGTSTPSELGRSMLRPKENMTKIIDDLAREGLVKRYRGGKDRRYVRIKLTPKGIVYMRKLLQDIQKEEDLVRSWLNPTERETVEKLSDKFSFVLNGKVRNKEFEKEYRELRAIRLFQ